MFRSVSIVLPLVLAPLLGAADATAATPDRPSPPAHRNDDRLVRMTLTDHSGTTAATVSRFGEVIVNVTVYPQDFREYPQSGPNDVIITVTDAAGQAVNSHADGCGSDGAGSHHQKTLSYALTIPADPLPMEQQTAIKSQVEQLLAASADVNPDDLTAIRQWTVAQFFLISPPGMNRAGAFTVAAHLTNGDICPRPAPLVITADGDIATTLAQRWIAQERRRKRHDPPSPWASARGVDQYGAWAELTVHGAVQRFYAILPGYFSMGSYDDQTDKNWTAAKTLLPNVTRERYVAQSHLVTLTRPYWLADSECSQAFWQAVTGTDPAAFRNDPQEPVESVSWNDCQTMLATLNRLDPRLHGRLPTEAEWENVATNADSKEWGFDPNLEAIAWYAANSNGTTHAVKKTQANNLGICDMLGNVGEWCNDWYGDFGPDNVSDPTGPATGAARVVRGGSWSTIGPDCHAVIRGQAAPDVRSNTIGLRICLPAEPEATP